jgi:hypothetical protein
MQKHCHYCQSPNPAARIEMQPRKREASLCTEKTIVVSLMALFFLASVSAFGADFKGMITSRT